MFYKPLILSVFSLVMIFTPNAYCASLHDTKPILLASRNGDGPTYDEVMREMDARKWGMRAQEREAKEARWHENRSLDRQQHQREKWQRDYRENTSSPAR